MPPALQHEWAAAYEQEASSHGGLNPRLLLAAGELQRAVGHSSAPHPPPLWRRLRLATAMPVPPCPVEAAVVANFEQALMDLVRMPEDSPPRKKPRAHAYPLPIVGSDGAAPTKLARAMHRQTQDSWEVHHNTPAPEGVQPG